MNITKPHRNRLRGALAALVILLTGCGINWLLPVWTKDVESNMFANFSFVSQDQQSRYSINFTEFGTPTLWVRQTTLTGDLIKQLEFPLPGTVFYASRRLVRADNDAFYLYSGSSTEVAYIDPVAETHWVGIETGLAENQGLLLNDQDDDLTAKTVNGKLVFTGSLVTRTGTNTLHSVPVVGLINSLGTLEKWVELTNLSEVLTLQHNNAGHVMLAGFTDTSPTGSKQNSFLEFDESLNLLQRTENDLNFSYIGFVQNRYIGTLYDANGAGTYRALNTSGEPQEQFNLYYNGAPEYEFHASRSGFFVVSDATEFNKPVVCHHDTQFKQQWCQRLDFIKGQNIKVEKAQLLDGSELLLTISSENVRITETALAVEPDPDGTQGNLEARGELRNELMHILFDVEGKRIAHAKAIPSVKEGRATRCTPYTWCIEDEEATQGYCHHSDTMALPGRGIYTLLMQCNAPYWQLAFWQL